MIGGKNSSVDAALELVKCGARVTVLYRGSEYSEKIKPWILPEFRIMSVMEQLKWNLKQW